MSASSLPRTLSTTTLVCSPVIFLSQFLKGHPPPLSLCAYRLDDERFIFATDASKSKQGHECMAHDQSVVIAGEWVDEHGWVSLVR